MTLILRSNGVGGQEEGGVVDSKASAWRGQALFEAIDECGALHSIDDEDEQEQDATG